MFLWFLGMEALSKYGTKSNPMKERFIKFTAWNFETFISQEKKIWWLMRKVFEILLTED